VPYEDDLRIMGHGMGNLLNELSDDVNGVMEKLSELFVMLRKQKGIPDPDKKIKPLRHREEKEGV